MRKVTTNKGVELLVPEKGEKHPNAGRPKGSKNVMTRALKDAIVLAAAKSQHAKDNGGGLGGYLTYLANEWPELFARLLAKLIPLQEKERAQTAKEPGKPVKPAAYRTAAAEVPWYPCPQGRYEGHAIIECDRRAIQKARR